MITGAGSGIGRALAERLSGLGCPVALCDWDEDGLAETAGALDGPVLQRKLDVSDRNAVLAFAAEVAEWAPEPIGMVVNNAGVSVTQPVAGAALEDDEWVFKVNFDGVVNGTQAFLPLLLEQGSGAIVNVSSTFGLIGFPAHSAYCASKHAVRGYTEALRHELRGSDVDAIPVHPGGIATNIVRYSRIHEDDRGRTDRVALERDFDQVARTSPEVAARIIHKGVERRRARILVGWDAKLLGIVLRVAPTRYFRFVNWMGNLARE